MDIRKQAQYFGDIASSNQELYNQQYEDYIKEQRRQEIEQSKQNRQDQIQQISPSNTEERDFDINKFIGPETRKKYQDHLNRLAAQQPKTNDNKKQQIESDSDDNYWWNTLVKGFQIFSNLTVPTTNIFRKALGIEQFDNRRKDYFSDAYTKMMTNKNETQIDTSLGKMSIADQMDRYISPEAMYDYVYTAQELISVNDRLNHLIDKYTTGTGLTDGESLEMDNLRKRSNELNSKKNHYESMFDKIKQYESLNGFTGAFSQMQSGLAEVDLDFGTGLGNSLRGFNENLTKMQKALANRDSAAADRYYKNLTDVYEKYRNRSKQMRNKWQQDIEEDRKDLERYSGYEVSEYFENQEQIAQDLSIFNPKKWLFQTPGLIGSSVSAPQKQIGAMALGLLSAYLTGGTSVAKDLLGKTLAVGTYGLNLSQGADENFANVAQATKEIMTAELTANGQFEEFLRDGREQLKNPNATAEDLYLAFQMGEYVPKNYKIRNTIINASVGSLKQFMQGQGVNTIDATFDTAIEVLPMGSISRATKLQQFKGDVKSMGEGFVTVIKDSKGVQKIIPLTQKIERSIDNIGTRAVKKLAEKSLKHASNVSDYAKMLPVKILQGKADLKTVRKGIKSLAKRSALSAYSEAIEEGLQQEQQYQRIDERDDNYFYAQDQWLNTIFSGPRLWTDYLLYDPETATERERDIHNNMSGGILGAWTQGGAVSTGQVTVGTVKEIRLNHAIANNLLASKMENDSNIEKGARYAKQIRKGRGLATRDKLLQYKQINERINSNFQQDGDPVGLDSKMIDEEVELFDNIDIIYHNKKFQSFAKDAGFKKDDLDYYASLLALHKNRVLDDTNQYKQSLEKTLKLQQEELEKLKQQQDPNETEEDLIKKQNVSRNLYYLKSLIDIRDYLDVVEKNKPEEKIRGHKLLSKQVQRKIDQFNKTAKLDIDTKEDVDKAFAENGLSINDELIESMREQSMYEVQLDIDANVYEKLQKDTRVAKKHVNHYKEVKKDDEKLRQDIENKYIEDTIKKYDVQDAVITNDNNVYTDRNGNWSVVVINPSGVAEKHLYNNGVLDEQALPFDKEEWYDFQEEKNKNLENISEFIRDRQDYDYYNALQNKINDDENLTAQESDDYERLVKKFTPEKIQQHEKRIGDIYNLNNLDLLQKAAPIYDDVYDIEQNGHEEQFTTVVNGITPEQMRLSRPTVNLKNGKITFSTLTVEELENNRQTERRVVEFNNRAGKHENRRISLSDAIQLESLLRSGYDVVESGGKYYLKNGSNRKQIGKVKYNYAQFYSNPNPIQRTENESNNSEQVRRTVQVINKFNADNNPKLHYELRTGYDYFIEDEDGNIHRYSRVHSVLPDMFTKEPNIYVHEYLNEARNSRDISELHKRIRNLQERYNRQVDEQFSEESQRNEHYINLDGYLKYCDLLNDSEAYNHVLRIFDAMVMRVSGINVGSQTSEKIDINSQFYIKLPTASVISGTIIDDINRRLFLGEDVQYDPSFMMSEKTFDSHKQNILAKKKEYEDKGYTILSNRYVWYADGIAGETDMILVDKNGGVHIVDFKTSQSSYTEQDGKIEAIDRQYRGAHFTQRTHYTDQLNTYSGLIAKCIGKPIEDLKLLGFYTLLKSSGSQYQQRVLLDEIVQIGSPEEVLIEKNDGIYSGLMHDKEQRDKLGQETLRIIQDLSDILSREDGRFQQISALRDNQNQNIAQRAKNIITALDNIRRRKQLLEIYDKSEAQNLLNSLNNIINESTQLLQDVRSAQNEQAKERLKNKPTNKKLRTSNQIEFLDTDQKSMQKLMEWSTQPDFAEKAVFYVSMSQFKRRRTDYLTFDRIEYNGEVLEFGGKSGNSTKGIRIRLAEADANGNEYLSVGLNHPIAIKLQSILDEKGLDAKVKLTDLSRSNGRIIFGKERHPVLKQLGLNESEQDRPKVEGLYDGKFGDQIGVVDQDGNLKGITQDSRLGNNRTIHVNQRGVEDKSKRLTPGRVMILHSLGYTENPGQKIPIYLDGKRVTENDVDVIIDCLQNDSRKHPVVNGIQSPLNYGQILKMLIRFGRATEEIPGSTFVFRYAYKDEQLNNPRPQTNEVDNTRVYIKIDGEERMYSLNNDADLINLKEYLVDKLYLYSNNVEILRSKLGGKYTSVQNHPFTFIAKWFEEHPDQNQLKFSESLVFDKEDIGKFGYHWMMSHGRLSTQYEGVTDAYIYANDVEVVNNKPKPDPNPESEDKPLTPEGALEDSVPDGLFISDDDLEILSTNQDDTDNDILGGPLLHKQRKGKKVRPINRKKAERTIRRITGDSIPVEFVDRFEDTLRDWDVVGMCKATSIALAENAENGTDFHEAFHAAVELLMDESERKDLYSYYRNKYGYKSERETAEDLADKFFNYSRYTFHPNNKIGAFFAKMWSWVRAYATTSDLKLARLFVQVDWGKYSNNVIKPSQIENFKRRFPGGLTMKIQSGDKTVEFKHIFTSTQLDDAINTLLYEIVRCEGLNQLGSNAKNLNLSKQYLTNPAQKDGKFESRFAKTYLKLTLMYDNLNTESALREKYEQGVISNLTYRNALIFRELFDNYEATQQLLFDKLRSIGIITTREKEEQTISNIEGGETGAIANDITGHSDEFYTHSRSEDVTSQIKFILSTRPALRYATQEDVNSGAVKSIYVVDKSGKEVVDKNGNKKRALVPIGRNSLGTVQFLDFKSVHQRLLSALSDVESVDDLYNRLHKLGENDYMFENIAKILFNCRWQSYVRYTNAKEYDNIPVVMYKNKRLNPKYYISDLKNPTHDELYPKRVYAAIDIKDKDGKIIFKKGDLIPGAVYVTNADMESLTTQLFQAIKSQHLSFNFVYARPYTDQDGNVKQGTYTYEFKSTNADQSVQQYPIQWFDNLRSSYSQLFKSGKTPELNKSFGGFKKAKKILNEILSQSYMQILTVDGKKYDVTKPEDADQIYSIFIQTMNEIGIGIDKPYLIYTLQNMDLSSTNLWNQFVELIQYGDGNTSGGLGTIVRDGMLLDKMQSAVEQGNVYLFLQDTPKLRNKVGDTISGAYMYSTNGFIRLLASQYGAYRQRNVELMTLGAENTKQYTFAQNHTYSDIVDNLNDTFDKNGNMKEGSIIKDLSQVSYVIHNGKGSIIVKSLTDPEFNPKHNKVVVYTASGVKLQNKREGGTKYIESTTSEDYISKMTMLQQGLIISPTLSDKSTYMVLGGFQLPGLNWDSQDIGILPLFNRRTGDIIFQNSDNSEGYSANPILDQFLEYFECEFENVKKTINDLGLYGETNTATPISENDKVKNYHTENINGARFFSLMGIYDENGNYVSFNFKDDSRDGGVINSFNKAYDTFFGDHVSQEKRRYYVAKILQRRLNDELKFLVENGIIEEVSRPASDPHPYFKYKNKLMDQDKIDALKNKYSRIADKYGYSAGESMAVVAMVYDTMCKSIMSMEEIRRVFTGMPQFFKTRYSDGKLVQYGVDETKRYGGLGSTGENNREDLPNVDSEYICAEIKDWEIGSSIYDTLTQSFRKCEYADVFINDIIQGERSFTLPGHGVELTSRELYEKVNSGEISEDMMREYLQNRGLLDIVDAKIKAEAESYLSEINVADGTAYISDTMAENLLRMRGAYNSKVKAAFDRLRGDKGYLNSVEDYQLIFDALISTQKYSAFGYRMQNGIPVHFYDKFALFPLFKGISYGFTRNLYNKMTDPKNPVDMVMFDSAVKSGSQAAQRFNPDMTDEEVAQFTFAGHTYKQKYKFIRRQLNTDPREDEEMQAGTQAMKIALSAIRPEQTYSLPVVEDGKIVLKSVNGSEYVSYIMGRMNEMADIGYNRVMEQFTDKNGQIDLVKFSKFAISELKNRNADKNILDALTCTYETDDNGNIIPETVQFTVDINTVSNVQWLETIINSVINKNAIDITFKGNAFYQRSIFGMDSPMKVISDKDAKYELNGGKPLQLINEEGSMDAVISIDYFKDIIPPGIFYNFNKAKQWLIDNDIISGVKTGETEWHNASAQTMGYRIPTQAPASISALRFVDVIPVVRDTIILPKEFTKLTGSDFDIDKLMLSSLYYDKIIEKYIDKNRKEKTRTKVTTINLKDAKQNLANEMLRAYLNLLKDRRYDHLKYRSIDNDTSLVTRIVSKIQGAYTKEVEPYQYEQLSNQVKTMQQFATGKVGIGPFALNNNNQILCQIYGIKFAHNPSRILTFLHKNNLGNIVDDESNTILSWISALINGHVDIARDPYVTGLNINGATYNLINLLLRTGFGSQALYFLNQPVVRELAQVELRESGNIVEDAATPKYIRIQKKTQEYIHNTFGDNSLDRYAKSKNNVKKGVQKNYFEIIKKIFDPKFIDGTRSILEDILVNKRAKIDPDKGLTVSNMSTEKIYEIDDKMYSPKDIQQILYITKDAFAPYANALNDLVQCTKIDTKKQGNTIQQQLSYVKKYNKLLENPMFDQKILHNMVNNSFIEKKTRIGCTTLQVIMGQIAIQATPAFSNLTDYICRYINDDSESARTKVTNLLLSYIKQVCMNQALRDNNFTEDDWRNMIYGNRTLASRIEGLKQWLLKDTSGKYEQLVSNGVIINPLLNNLRRLPYLTKFGNEHYDFITLDNTQDDSQEGMNNYIDAWQQLLEFTVTDDDGNLTKECLAIRKLANDLAIYAFMTSADSRGFTKFFKYVPISWRRDFGYDQYIRQAHQQFMYGDVQIVNSDESRTDGVFTFDIDEFFMNFAYDDTIIPYTDKYTTTYDGLSVNRFVGTSRHFNILDENGEIVDATEYAILFPTYDIRRIENTGAFPRYIKLRRNGTNRNSADSFLLYTNIATYLTKNGTARPVYGLVTPKGFSTKIGSQVYQFYSIERDDVYKHIYERENIPVTTAQQYMSRIDDILKNFAKFDEAGNILNGSVLLRKFQNPVGISAEELATLRVGRNRDVYTPVGRFGIYTIEASTGYHKNEPQENRDYFYLYTENLQALFKSYGFDTENEFIPQTDRLQLNVSSANGTNQAVIRTDSNGVFTENAEGIVVKKYQQNESGDFVQYEGQFEDTDSDFKAFVNANSRAFAYIRAKYENSEYSKLIVPKQMATRRSALPLRFAQWLQEKIQNELGVRYEVIKNTQEGYDGYGLVLSESNTVRFDPTSNTATDTAYKQIEDLEEILGGKDDPNVASEIQDTVKTVKKGLTFKDVLDTVKPVFTEEEISKLKQVFDKTGKLMIKSVSRFTDPAFFANEIIKSLEENDKIPFGDTRRYYAMELWTKHDGLPIQNILRACKQYKVAPMVSFSITGLGDTPLEKGVLKYNDLLDRIEQLIQAGDLDPRTTTVRLDPILVGYTNMEDIKKIVARCKSMGIRKFVTSLVQSYGYLEGTSSTRKVVSGINAALAEAGQSYNWEEYYGIISQDDVNISRQFINEFYHEHPELHNNKLVWGRMISEAFAKRIRLVTPSSVGKIHFTPKFEYVDQVGDVLRELNKDPEIEIESCSFTVQGLKASACLDPLIIERLTGADVTSEDGTYKRDTSRPDCMCYGAHQDMFRMDEKKCFSSCAYCYAGQSDSNNFRYYDDNGNLVDRKITRVDTGRSQQNVLLDDSGKPVTMYRGYALSEDREAFDIEETIGNTAVDYDDSLKGAIYFTSSEDEAKGYANARADSSEEEFIKDDKVVKQKNRHYTGGYAKVGRYYISANAKVEYYKNIADYKKNGKNSTADVVILNEGTLSPENTEYVVLNRNVIVPIRNGIEAIRQVYAKTLDENSTTQASIQDLVTPEEMKQAKQIREHCKPKGDES